MDTMRDFLDSTDLMNDGPALAERLEHDGYLFLRGVLPREAVMKVRRRLLEKAAAGGWLDPDHPIDHAIADSSAACKDPEEPYMKVFRGIWADEELHRLRTRPEVLALFERIFGEPVLVHPMFVQRNIFPQSESFDFTTGAHQDKVHIGGATNYAMWVPLGDCQRCERATGSIGRVPSLGRAGHQGRQWGGRHGYLRSDSRRVGHRLLRGG